MHRTIAALGALAAAAATLAAGPLDPPPGPIEPTMKTLDEVEPRRPINSTETPGNALTVYRITQPGSYYLTDNVGVFESQNVGIEIAASNVTIDLNGYTIRAFGAAATEGIQTDGPNRTGIRIRNGAITGFLINGIKLDDLTRNAVIEDVRITESGVGIEAGLNARIRRCTVTGGTGDGIQVGDGAIIEDCLIAFNLSGIRTAAYAMIRGCVIRNNSSSGVVLDGAACMVRDCVVTQNAGNGIIARADGSLIADNVVHGNATGISVTIGPAAAPTTSVAARNVITDSTTKAIETGLGGDPKVGTIVNDPAGAGAWDNVVP